MTMMEHALWSDRFFNYPQAERAYPIGELTAAASEFTQDFPECPMSAAELVQDFKDRV